MLNLTFAQRRFYEETILETSEMGWVTLRLTTLTNGKKSRKYNMFTDSKYGTRWHIYRAGVAECMSNLAEIKTYIKEHVQVGY